MEANTPTNSNSRLEEALHPEIGNGAGPGASGHEAILRQVDPSKAIEAGILTEQQLVDIAELWQNELDGETEKAEEAEEAEEAEKAEKAEAAEKTEKAEQGEVAEKAEVAEKIEKTEKAEVVEEKVKAEKASSKTPGRKSISVRTKQEEKVKAGKRVRKLAEQEAEKAISSDRSLRERFTTGAEEPLTPFAQWLKGLKGSEYVHPYEDDFAFLQSEGPVREGISETYADLLAAQGYRDQAIEMYRRLMEKFPEKSRFFAAKIDALQ